MSRRVVARCALAGAVVLALAGCDDGADTASSGTRTRPTSTTATVTTTAPTNVSYRAQVKATVPTIAIYDSPDAATPARQLDNPWLYDPNVATSQVPQVFLVTQRRADGWVQVLLPVRPNGSTGWVRASDVDISANPYRIDVSLSAHTITVHNGASVVYTGPVAVGATDPPLPDTGKPTPTPTGEYYLRVLIQAPDPNTVYGPYAYGLSSHSDALDTFAGGDGEIGIHGNDDASVLGTNATHGCIRMDNAAITMLAAQLPLGTPVSVTA